MTSRPLLLSLMLTAGACTGGRDTLDGPIDYRVDGGFTGRGDGTPAIHIELDGTMTRTRSNALPEVIQLDPAAFAAIRDEVEQARLPTLLPSYNCDCADDFRDHLSAGIDGAVRDVAADYSADAPESLRRALRALRALARS